MMIIKGYQKYRIDEKGRKDVSYLSENIYIDYNKTTIDSERGFIKIKLKLNDNKTENEKQRIKRKKNI